MCYHITAEHITVAGKGGTVRTIPTHRQIWAHIQGRPAGLLVRTPAGGQYHSNQLSGAFSARAQRYGAHGLTLHGLRHHYADSLRRAGVDLEVVRILLRHSSLATTQRYLAADDRELAAGIGQLLLAA